VQTLDDVIDSADVVITATGNRDIVTVEQMQRMKHLSVVATSVTSTTRSTWPASLPCPASSGSRSSPRSTSGCSPTGTRSSSSRKGGCSTSQRDRAPELRDEQLVHESDDRADRALHERRCLPARRPRAPKHLDEKVARLHVEALGARLTTLRPEQAAYIGIPVDGPYKPDQYRY